MTTLKELQEKAEEEFDTLWGEAPPLSFKYDRGLELKSFLSHQTTLAFEAGKRERDREVVEMIDEAKRIGQGINPFPTEAGSALDSLKAKLLAKETNDEENKRILD